MKTASLTFNADGTMTLLCGDESNHFESLSRLVNYCNDNSIAVREIHTIQ